MLRFKESEKGGTSTRLDDPDRYHRIRCPVCKWQPQRQDRWQCSCTHVWNTFDTRGVCPACHRTWLDTKCPRCDEWSPHESWYTTE